ncbi:hypothetical protein CK203_022332 [Vitis vinifera]|uniref:Uncharacterized protein n=1 Tax=Vitis vinifera TaxID=29760 RepID=A0A438I9F9_VITVI|nr:hypothetical protein CK203_022332 [Vitis vinifera]
MMSNLELENEKEYHFRAYHHSNFSLQNVCFDVGIRKHHDIQTSVVCHIFDGDGEVAAGVASVEAIENFLTSDWIRQFKCNICSAPVLMVDANLSPSALEASCQMAAESSTPVWFEPVSVIKSRRVASVAKYITFASPNEDELIAMANALSCKDVFHPIQRDDVGTKCSIESLFQMLKPAILVLLEKGLDVLQSVAAGIAAAKAAVEGETNVPSEYSLAKIADDARRVYSSAKVISHQSML